MAILLLLAGCATTKKVTDEFVPPVFPSPPDEPRFIYERTFISNADVVEIGKTGWLKSFATGVKEKAQGMTKPYGVAVHKGKIYITDTQKASVTMFDAPGRRFNIFGNSGASRLQKPLSIDISEAGEVFVCDVGAKAIRVYDTEGRYLRSLGGKETLKRPVGVAVNKEGTRLYVVDNGGVSEAKGHHVVVFDAQTGEQLQIIGERGKDNGQFNLPLQARVDDEGNLHVVDGGNFRVQSFTPEGEFKLAFGKLGRLIGDFNRPKGIAVDAEGNIYITDAVLSSVIIYNKKGELLMFFGERDERAGPAKYRMLAGTDVDEDGRLYVVDQVARKIDVFRPYGMKADEGYLGAKMMEDGSLNVKPPTRWEYKAPVDTAEDAVEGEEAVEGEAEKAVE